VPGYLVLQQRESPGTFLCSTPLSQSYAMEGYFGFMRSVTVVSVLHHYTHYTHYTYYSCVTLKGSMFSFSCTFEPIVIFITSTRLNHTTAQTGGPGRLLPAT
jgi:hypothetical protein